MSKSLGEFNSEFVTLEASGDRDMERFDKAVNELFQILDEKQRDKLVELTLASLKFYIKQQRIRELFMRLIDKVERS